MKIFLLAAASFYFATVSSVYSQVAPQRECLDPYLESDMQMEVCEPLPLDPSPPPCPAALSVPAPQWQVECKATINGPRCNGPLSAAQCQQFNDESWARGYLDLAAYNWLNNNGQCAISAPGTGILSICPSGCFEENTAILTVTDEGQQRWVAAKDISFDDRLLSLDSKATLTLPLLNEQSIERRVYGPESTDLYVFRLTNDRTLRVTQYHIMVLIDGSVVEAGKVRKGDLFVGVDGTSVMVESVGREATSADVYNFSVAVETPQEHVIVAEGVLVGDLAWQSTLASDLESIRARR